MLRPDHNLSQNPNGTDSVISVGAVHCFSVNHHITNDSHSSRYKASSISDLSLQGFHHKLLHEFSERVGNNKKNPNHLLRNWLA